jgi:hypothetical protein
VPLSLPVALDEAPPTDNVALRVRGLSAVVATLTLSLIGLAFVPAAIEADDAQPAEARDQPIPEALL